MERRQNHEQQPVGGEQYAYWAIMTGKAKPTIDFLFDHPCHVFYPQEGHWTCLYELLLLIAPEIFLQTMERIDSPLMLSVLVSDLALSDFKEERYLLLLRSKWSWMHDLTAEWAWRNYQYRNLDFEDILNALDPKMQLEQSAYVLSRAGFHARLLKPNTLNADRERAESLCDSLTNRIVRLCNESDFPDDEKMGALKKVKDCEDISDCRMKLAIARSLHVEEIRDWLLDRIIEAFMAKMKGENLLALQERDQQLIESVIEAVLLRHGAKFESFVVSKILSWDALNDWTEPYLKDRDYWRWSYAQKIVGWNMQFLFQYEQRGNPLTGKMKVYWERGNSAYIRE